MGHSVERNVEVMKEIRTGWEYDGFEAPRRRDGLSVFGLCLEMKWQGTDDVSENDRRH